MPQLFVVKTVERLHCWDGYNKVPAGTHKISQPSGSRFVILNMLQNIGSNNSVKLFTCLKVLYRTYLEIAKVQKLFRHEFLGKVNILSGRVNPQNFVPGARQQQRKFTGAAPRV